MGSLAERRCIPCRVDVPPLTRAQLAPLVAHIDGARDVRDVARERRGSVTMLEREHQFKPGLPGQRRDLQGGKAE